jgi:hypothetical protein
MSTYSHLVGHEKSFKWWWWWWWFSVVQIYIESYFSLECVVFSMSHISKNISGPLLVHFNGGVPDVLIEDGGSMYALSI